MLLTGFSPAGANTNVPRAGEVLLLDAGTTSSGVLALNTQTATVRQVTSQGVFSNPRAVAWGGRKRIYVGDGPRIHKVNPYDGLEAAIPSVTHPYLREIVDMIADPAGGFWVLDRQADPLGQGTRGALFHYDPDSDVIELVVTSAYFDAPRSIVTESQGTLLLMDPTGRVDIGGSRVGAIYRIDPDAYTVEPLTTLEFGILPVGFSRLDPTTLLIVDSNFSVPGMPVLGGAVLKVSSFNFEVLDTLAIPEFRDPVDAIPMGDGSILVVDTQADAGGSTFLIQGDTGELIREIDSTIFSLPWALNLMEGVCLDNSTFSVQLLDGSRLRPGGRLRIRADLVNLGDLFTHDFRLTIATAELEILLGTAQVPSGSISWDPAAGQFHWDSALGGGALATLEVDARLPSTAQTPGTLMIMVDLLGERVETHGFVRVPVAADMLADKLFILDNSTNAPAPRIYSRFQTQLTPLAMPAGVLTQPIDIAFGPDGSLYVMDNFEGNGIIKINRVDLQVGGVTLVRSGGVSRYSTALAGGHDGQLLVADPRVLSPFFSLPGIIWEIDPSSGAIDTFFVHPDLIDPFDITPVQNGMYLIVDKSSSMLPSNPGGGGLFLVDRDGELISMRSFSQFEDPVSGTVRPNGQFLIVDQQSSTSPLDPKIFEVRWTGFTWTLLSSVLSGLSHPLKEPYGIETVHDMSIQGGYWVCERRNNPTQPGDTGLLLRLFQEEEVWGYSTEHMSYSEFRSPSRAAVYKAPRNYIDDFRLEGVGSGPLAPGDTLTAVATIFNNAPIPAVGSVARIAYTGAIEFLDADLDYGEATHNPDFGTIEWSGNLAYAERTTIRTRFRVGSPPSAIDPFSITLSLSGVGISPPPRTVTGTIMAPPVGHELLVLDQRADPFGLDHSGSLYLYAPGTNRILPFTSHWFLKTPSDILPLNERELIILDSDADPRAYGGLPGALLKLDLQTNVISNVATYRRWVTPMRLLPTAAGTWLILDSDAEVMAGDARGVVYEFDPRVPDELEALTLLSASTLYRSLSDMTLDDEGNLWLTDLSANPHGQPGFPGAIFKVDAASGALLETYASEEIPEPSGILYVPGEGLLVADPGIRDQFGNIAIRRFDPDTGAFAMVASSPELVRPARMILYDERTVMIVDRSARVPLYDPPPFGALFELDLTLGLIRAVGADPSTVRLRNLARVPQADVRLVSFTAAEDSTGRYASWGDTLHCTVTLANVGGATDPEIQLAVEPSEHLFLDTDSGSATSGQVWVSSDGVTWSGSLAGGGSVQVQYSAVVRSEPELSAFARQTATMTSRRGASGEATLRHHVSTTLGSQEVVLVDARANPLGLAGGSGALFRFAEPNRVPVAILADSSFVSPVGIKRIPGSESEFLIVDADASVGWQSGGGALLRASTITGEVEVLFANMDLVEPRAVALVDSSICYLLDSAADPFGYTPGFGPGAIYRIDLRTGEGTVVFSDTLASALKDIAFDPFRRSLLIVDSQLDAGGSFGGGLIEYFLEPEDPEEPYRVVASGAPFEGPRAVEVSRDSSWVLLDFSTRQGIGTLYRVTPEGATQAQGFCSSMQDPVDLAFDVGGELLMIDRNADPQGFGGNTGTVFRRRSGSGLNACTVFRSGPPLVSPRSADSYFDPTPVLMHLFELAESTAGIELRWSAPSMFAGAHFYVYRRALEDPGSEYELLNAHRPVSGSGDLTYLDEQVTHGELYAYKLVASLVDGGHQAFGPLTIRVALGQGAVQFGLQGVYPNPAPLGASRDAITVRYSIPSPGGKVRLGLYDVTGRLVHWLVHRQVEPGTQVVAWDGRDERGAPVESGLYFLRLEAGARVMNRRLILVR